MVAVGVSVAVVAVASTVAVACVVASYRVASLYMLTHITSRRHCCVASAIVSHKLSDVVSTIVDPRRYRNDAIGEMVLWSQIEVDDVAH